VNPTTAIRSPRTWRFRLAIVLAGIALFYLGANWALRSERVHRFLLTRLEASFGRPVEVGGFTFAFLPEPELVAARVTVEEDPRFGAEYFVRAEELSAGLRWTALARGRLEFDTVTLSRPSMNLVRLPDGRWNLESWLPPLPSPGAAHASAHAPRLTRVRIREGRINFKRGVDKHPFALVNLEGSLLHESIGPWQADLEAELFRAGVNVQQAGKLRLRGRIGGTLARLRPAELELTWSEASLADALRLLRGRDFGVRGQIDLELLVRSGLSAEPQVTTRTIPAAQVSNVAATNWKFQLNARARGIHRWDFAERPDDPALNLISDATWDPVAGRLQLSRLQLEAPASNIRGSGFVQWGHPQSSQVRLLSAGIAWNDLLAWWRAFRAGVSSELRIEGGMGLDAALGGWPVRVERASLASDGARIRLPGLSAPIFVSRMVLAGTGDHWQLSPFTLTLPRESPREAVTPDPRRGQVAVMGSASFGTRNEFQLRASGVTQFVEELAGASAHFGFPLAAGWTMEGAARGQLLWQGTLRPLAARSSGNAQLTNLRLRPRFLNHPVLLRQGRIEWRGAGRNGVSARVIVDAAEALGARWTGSMTRGSGDPWQFSLAADRLSPAELDAWLNPRRERTLLQRALERLPFARRSPAAPELEDSLNYLRASGTLQVGQFQLGQLELENLNGTIQLDPRELLYQPAEADFYGGKIRGTIGARFQAQPQYRASVVFDRVKLERLVNEFPSLRELFSGTARGRLDVEMVGSARTEVLDSLKGRGQLQFDRPVYTGLDLSDSIQSGTRQSGRTAMRSGTAEFVLGARTIRFSSLTLRDGASFFLRGSCNFTGELMLEAFPALKQAKSEGKTGSEASSEKFWLLTGTLKDPRIQPMVRKTAVVP
jgi:uncharacterized protein involved in outer membrane biogenesis